MLQWGEGSITLVTGESIMKRTFNVTYQGTTVNCEIGACCWMYPGYGLQVTMALPHGQCNRTAITKKFMPMTKTNEQTLKAAKALALEWLRENDGVTLLRNIERSYAATAPRIEASEARAEAAFQRRQAAKMARYKANGYTHYFYGVVHPEHGDDYEIEAFIVGKPSKAQITTLLKKSVVKNDYRVTAL